MRTELRIFQSWLWFALLCIFWWGLWGFLSKIGSVSASPLQMQICSPWGCYLSHSACSCRCVGRWTVTVGGITYGILSGVVTGLGTLGYYAALRNQDAS